MRKMCKVIYKCRLCKKEFESGTYGTDMGKHLDKIPLAIHVCEDGRRGIGDATGLREIPIPKEELEEDEKFRKMLDEVLG